MTLRRWLWLPAAGILLFIIGFITWAYTPLGPMPEATAALIEGDGLIVDQSQWIAFTPGELSPKTGFILYPGARVDPVSYAPIARAIAARGYQVIVVPMPLNLAIFGQDRAGFVISSYPHIENWAIGGHSLGGVMAANYALKNPQTIDALILLAAYPAPEVDLSTAPLKAVSIFGSQDGLLTTGVIDSSRNQMPEHTRWVSIVGGNHAQFGWYEVQPGDNPASISRQYQQDQSVEAIVEILTEINQ